jgi:hypothetical protein
MSPHSSRRAFLTNVATAALGPVVLGRGAFAQNPPARVDALALRQRIEALSVFGRPSGGTFADGVGRVAYSALHSIARCTSAAVIAGGVRLMLGGSVWPPRACPAAPAMMLR